MAAAANATVTLVIGCEESRLAELVQPASAPHEAANALANFLQGAAYGSQNASIDAYSVATAPVAASGTITLTYASIVAGTDTVTVGGQVLTSSSSTTDGTHWKVVTDGPTTAANIATCINTNTNLKNVLTATSSSASGGTVTITCNEKGTLGNLVGLASSNGTGAAVSAATLANGAGGMSGTATTYRLGL